MKKLLAGIVVGVALLGVGCSQSEETAPLDVTTGVDGTVNKPDVVVEGEWYLAFTLPEGWIMAPHYDETFAKLPTETIVTSDMSDVVIQSTDRIVSLTGSTELPEGMAVTDDYTYIRVFRMEMRSLIPGEAEDIGSGFSKLEKGVNATYYYEGAASKYKFIVYRDNQNLSVAEGVITSAQEVTSLAVPTAE